MARIVTTPRGYIEVWKRTLVQRIETGPDGGEFAIVDAYRVIGVEEYANGLNDGERSYSFDTDTCAITVDVTVISVD